MRTKVICHISDFNPEYPGSFVDALLRAALYSREFLGLETLCIFPERARGRQWLSQFDVHRVAYVFVSSGASSLLKLKQCLSRVEPVIFHCHFVTFDLSALALKLLYYRHAKVIWHFHSVCSLSAKQRCKDLVKVRLLANHSVDRFIAVSDNVAMNASQRGFDLTKLTTNHNGINTGRFAPDKKEREKVRRDLGVSDDCTVFLNLGYDPVIKGVDVFLKAAHRFVSQGKCSALFVVIGRRETREFIGRMEEARRLAPRLQVREPIHNFASFLNGVDVLVSSSRSEGFSYAWLEAMTAEKLILASDIPSTAETCGEAAGVFMFPSEDATVLASLMQETCKMVGAEKDRLGAVNSEYVLSRYSLDSWAKRLGETYRSVLGVARPLSSSGMAGGDCKIL